MHLWGRLLPQAEMTLNLFHTSRLHPQLSAAAYFHGLVDYNKTAFAPPGCNIIAHESHHRGELGHPMANLATPWVLPCIIIYARMTDALKHPHPHVPFSTIGDDTITALTTLASILKNKLKSL
jgi:hypothetical protein